MTKFELRIRSENDILISLRCAGKLMREFEFNEIERQKVLVSISELTRNVLFHSGTDGLFICEAEDTLLRITVSDRGRGIADHEQVLQGKKNENSKGLGLGLIGVKRLMDEFHINTSPGEGTTVTVIKYREPTLAERRL
ncbi:ATP-binding protein [Marinicrinis lubricantis]|uniref:ATP-binding protein n=1 Tax=Marinicrinis lubricantis TaxID=2086470 RepID=A0ABW1IVL9_9BACL